MHTLKKAVELARFFEKQFYPNYHIALGGSCLHEGESKKDIDLYIYPRSETMLSNADGRKVFRKLSELNCTITGVYLNVEWKENYPNKPFIQFTIEDVPVDLFFISWCSIPLDDIPRDDVLIDDPPF